MSDLLQFELVSPEKLLISKDVAMVAVPGGEGDYGVLLGHAPMITTVKPGVIEICDSDMDNVSDRIFVSGGFAEVTQTRCTVLAEEAIAVGDLNRARLEEENKALTAQLAGASAFDQEVLQGKLEVVAAKLQAAA